MRSIGFRAQPKQVDYVVIEGSGGGFSVITGDQIVTPKALNLPDQLSYLRVVVHDLIAEYRIGRAGIRLTEKVAENQSIDRVRIEAVIQEALAGSSVTAYFTGRLNSIASRVPGHHSASELKALINNGASYLGIEDWTSFGVEQREALLVAIAALQVAR